jgi:hypothetical protein
VVGVVTDHAQLHLCHFSFACPPTRVGAGARKVTKRKEPHERWPPTRCWPPCHRTCPDGPRLPARSRFGEGRPFVDVRPLRFKQKHLCICLWLVLSPTTVFPPTILTSLLLNSSSPSLLRSSAPPEGIFFLVLADQPHALNECLDLAHRPVRLQYLPKVIASLEV